MRDANMFMMKTVSSAIVLLVSLQSDQYIVSDEDWKSDNKADERRGLGPDVRHGPVVINRGTPRHGHPTEPRNIVRVGRDPCQGIGGPCGASWWTFEACML
jgi:hypothetical protein